MIVPRLSCYVPLAGEEPWDQPRPFLCSFPIALHCIIPNQTSTCHLALFFSSLSSFGSPSLNLAPFVSHNHLQRVPQSGAGCCCSQLELVRNTRAPEVDRAFPHLGAGCVAGKQINPPWVRRAAFVSLFLIIAPPPEFPNRAL